MPRLPDAPPAFERESVIGLKGKVFSKLSLRVKHATVRYPKVSISLSLANGKGSCFATLNDQMELRTLIEWLTTCEQSINSILPELQKEQAIIQTQLVETAQKLEAFNQMKDQILDSTSNEGD